jgi:hypothetical protein
MSKSAKHGGTVQILATVAVSATGAALAPTAADAGNASPQVKSDGYVWGLELGVGKSNLPSFFNEVVPETSDIPDILKLGDDPWVGYAAISLGREVSPNRDWRITGTLWGAQNRKRSFADSDDDVQAELGFRERFYFQTLDMDLGRTWPKANFATHNVSLRAFAGVRVMHATETVSSNLSVVAEDPSESGSFDKLGRATFWGVGPRVGFEAIWGKEHALFTAGSISYVYGYAKSSLSTATSGSLVEPIPSFLSSSSSGWKGVSHVHGAVGYQWSWSPNTVLLGGYRVDRFDGIGSSFSGGGSFTSHGPFVRVDMRY